MVSWLLLAMLTADGGMAPIAPGNLEGRPPPVQASPLQALVDAAPAGGTVEVGPGTYRGDVYLDRALRLVGRGRPRLLGSGEGSVVRIRAPGVTLEGFDIDGLGGGDLGADSSGVHVAAPGAVIRDCRIEGSLFGIYLRAAPGARLEANVVRGIPGKEPGEKGSGIHVWNTEGFELTGNVIEDTRDGIYIQSSSRGFIRGNVARDLRYGLHYMFSDDNVFEDNLFERAAAGTVLMYSNRITFRRNRFLHNRGFASVGLLFKECNDSLAEDNLLADNARGVFLEGAYRNLFRRNVIAESDAAVVLYTSAAQNVFEGNSFLGYLTPLILYGRRTDTRFDGNYWSDDAQPDLDGDGRRDRSYRLTSLFDHLRGNLIAADLLAQSPAAAALAVAERTFPVLDPVEVEDGAPLARPPELSAVPRPGPRRPGRHAGGILCALGLVVLGASALVAWRAPGGRGARA